MIGTSVVRELLLHPWDIALLTTGELILFSSSLGGRYLEAYDADLAVLWSRPVGDSALGLNVDPQGTPWVLDRTGASAYSRAGHVDASIVAPVFQNMEVAALTFVDDDLLFAYQHTESAPPHSPVLARIGRDGTVRWSATLMTQSRLLEDESWWCSYVEAGELTVSGDTVLAVYGDIPRSGLSIGYAVSLMDGALRYTTQRGPIHSVASRGGGAFLVGYMGYDAFDTVLYDRQGNERVRWDSHGYYVIRGDDIRVVETENIVPSRCRLSRLMPDGTVIRGDILDGYYTSRPYVHGDGTLYFARGALLIAARDLMIDKRILIVLQRDYDVIYTRVVGADDNLFLTYTKQRVTQDSGYPAVERKSGLLRISL